MDRALKNYMEDVSQRFGSIDEQTRRVNEVWAELSAFLAQGQAMLFEYHAHARRPFKSDEDERADELFEKIAKPAFAYLEDVNVEDDIGQAETDLLVARFGTVVRALVLGFLQSSTQEPRRPREPNVSFRAPPAKKRRRGGRRERKRREAKLARTDDRSISADPATGRLRVSLKR